MPRLILYDDGTSAMEFSRTETRLHQQFWSSLRFRDPRNIQVVANNIVLLEMHKHVLLEPKGKQ